jgi:hypothetical protein
LLRLREQALMEWCRAESYEDVRSAWSRLGGKVVLHRYGREHFRLLALHRHDDQEALSLLQSRMVRRREAARV